MALKKMLAYLFTSRVIILLFAVLAKTYIPQRSGYLGDSIWANFDGRHFLEIATIGYRGSNFVFFPLYPTLIWLLGQMLPLTKQYLAIGISLLAFTASTWAVYAITRLDYKPHIAMLTIVAILIFPTSFFLNSVYSVSTVLFLVTSSFLSARKNHWLAAALLAGLATAGHLTALAIVPALAVEWYTQKRKLLKAWPYVAIALSGISTYAAYLQVKFGDWLLFMKALTGWHRQRLTFPLQVPIRYLKIFVSVSPKLGVYWVAVLEFATFLGVLLLALFVWKKVRRSYSVFMFGILLISSLSGSYIGIAKYALFMFPAFIGIGVLLSKKSWVRVTLIGIFIVLQVILTGLFTRGHFIA